MNFTRSARISTFALAIAVVAAARGVAQSTTVILVRHAEKAATPANDPPLTPAGEERAIQLRDAVKDAGVKAIITTHFLRTKATARPTATALGITPEELVATAPSHISEVAAAVRKHAGQTVLVVGHSNTVPAIIQALGAAKPPEICDPEYDNLYVVTIAPDGKAGVVRSKFGARAPAEACTSMKK